MLTEQEHRNMDTRDKDWLIVGGIIIFVIIMGFFIILLIRDITPKADPTPAPAQFQIAPEPTPPVVEPTPEFNDTGEGK